MISRENCLFFRTNVAQGTQASSKVHFYRYLIILQDGKKH